VGAPGRIPGWLALLTVFFVWAPRLLTHKLITRRALLPSAIITAVGLVGLMLLSGRVMEFWVTLYSKDYGGLGIVMAIFFWLGFSSLIIVAAAALAPALHDRRDLHRELHPRFVPGIHRRPHRHPHPHRPHLHRHRHWQGLSDQRCKSCCLIC
jgi:membrane protein